MKRGINLFAAMEARTEKKAGPTGMTVVSIVLIALCVFVVAGLFYLYFSKNMKLAADIGFYDEMLSDETLNEAAQQVDLLAERQAVVTAYENSVASLAGAYSSLSTLDSALLKAVTGALPEDVTLDGLTYENGALTLKLSAPARVEPAQCALALEGTGEFVQAHYFGYTYVEEEEQYVFSLSCTLKGGQS
jgi:Tfp pilus assembly protein PilN